MKLNSLDGYIDSSSKLLGVIFKNTPRTEYSFPYNFQMLLVKFYVLNSISSDPDVVMTNSCLKSTN